MRLKWYILLHKKLCDQLGTLWKCVTSWECNMSSYFRWIKSGKKDDYFGAKPRSRSLDSKSLEASGIRLIIENVLEISYPIV